MWGQHCFLEQQNDILSLVLSILSDMPRFCQVFLAVVYLHLLFHGAVSDESRTQLKYDL